MPENNSDLRFNYIITIHNKQDLIKDVLSGVLKCMHKNSVVIPVLDGCTDGSEKIVDDIIKSNPDKAINKVFADDVHELKAINIGLKASDQTGDGYNIILQDDVIIKDHDIENKVVNLYSGRTSLGIVSFRHGANLSRALAKKKKNIMPLKDHIENIKGHNYDPFSVIPEGCFTYREIAIKSPICIPFNVIRKVGLPDERYAPWDDIAYCYSITEAGFNNGVYAIDFESDILWGTTRKKKQELGISAVEKKNIALFKEHNLDKLLKNKIKAVYNRKIYRIDAGDARSAVNASQFFKGLQVHFMKKIRYCKHLLLDR